MAVVYKSYRAEYEKFLMENLALATEAVAVEIWSHAKQYHTFKNRTGELEKSIRIRKEKVNREIVHYSVRAGIGESSGIRNGSIGASGSSKAFYAVYLELGTVKMTARPYLRPALEKFKNRYLSTIKKIYSSAERKFRRR